MSSDEQQRTTMYLPAELLEQVRERVGQRGVSKLVRELLEGWLGAPEGRPSSVRVEAAPAATPPPRSGMRTGPRPSVTYYCVKHDQVASIDRCPGGRKVSDCRVEARAR